MSQEERAISFDGNNPDALNDANSSERPIETASQPDVINSVWQDTSLQKDDEPSDVLMHKQSMISFDVGYCLNEDRKSGRVHDRSRQAIIHTAYTDSRICELERQLLQLRRDYYKIPAEPPAATTKKVIQHTVYKHVLKRSTWADYRLTPDSMKIPPEERPSLEVLVSEGAIGKPSQRSPEAVNLSTVETHLRTPQQLRIRFRPLLIHLHTVTGVEATEYTAPAAPPDHVRQSSLVFLRPFKYLTTHAHVIRESLRTLEDPDSNATKSITEPESSVTDDSYDKMDLLDDLRLLVEFLDHDLRGLLELRTRIANGENVEIEYSDLWHLFQRGDIVTTGEDSKTAYRVLHFAGGREIMKKNGKSHTAELDDSRDLDGFTVDCMCLVSDGSAYRPSLHQVVIRPFTGYRRITSLAVFPLRFLPNHRQARNNLLMQGRAYLDLTLSPFKHQIVAGKTLDEPPTDIDGQVIVDMTLAHNLMKFPLGPEKLVEDDFTLSEFRETTIPPMCADIDAQERCCGSDGAHKDLNVDESELSDYIEKNSRRLKIRMSWELDDEDKLIFAEWVYGFVLRSRRWVKLKVADLKPVKFGKGFETSLIMRKSHKATIKSLVQTHESASLHPKAGVASIGSGLDVVKGKGTGLIILLHGEPGTGKTMTAECVADDTNRPLLPVTCGDIGETAQDVEQNLQANFDLAQKWGCVMLLDEADVFLARRNRTDLRRNAVVSVFLRSLEYYAGILFLTTNRVGSIDPAFKSRIHLSLFYRPLDIKATRGIYEMFIKRAEEQQALLGSHHFQINKDEIMKFADRHFENTEEFGTAWNGRQIRNAFQAAIALATHETQEKSDGKLAILGKKHFKTVAECSRLFENYLMVTLQETERDLANRERIRTNQPVPTKARREAGRSRRKRYPSEDETSESSSEDDDDDDDFDNDDIQSEDDRRKASRKKGKRFSKH